jgi:metal iron transporter
MVMSLRNIFLRREGFTLVNIPSVNNLHSMHLQLLPLAVGILGATVMPHSLFLGSALATQDRVSFRAKQNTTSTFNKGLEELLPITPVDRISIFRRFYKDRKEAFFGAFRKPFASVCTTAAKSHSERENNPCEFVEAHLNYGVFDMVGSLLGFAVMINSLWSFRLLSC